tara:strand:+ start:378 stop:884 length:507 start_codon:yes stop_codon:yes gene_type:complete
LERERLMLYVKLFLALVVMGGLAGGVTYVYKLKADLATSEANNFKLEGSVEEQKAVIAQQALDIDNIRTAMKEQAELAKRLNASIKDLRNKFNKVNASGEKRDIGNLAEQKPKLMQRAINRGTKNALRCMEIAMGSPLTEKEKNAVKKSQINPECPDIANPSYVPYGN